MAVTNANAYMKGKVLTKLITLPTKLSDGSLPVWKIRKAGIPTILRLFSEIGIEIMVPKSSEEIEATSVSKLTQAIENLDIVANLEMMIRVFLADCVIEPRVVLSSPGPADIPYEAVDPVDALFVFEQIWTFSGLGGPAKEQRDF